MIFSSPADTIKGYRGYRHVDIYWRNECNADNGTRTRLLMVATSAPVATSVDSKNRGMWYVRRRKSVNVKSDLWEWSKLDQ